VLVSALNTKANLLAEQGRPAESNALLSYAVELAVDQDLGNEAIRGFFNLADGMMAEARFAEAEQLLGRGLALARRRGDRQGERQLLAQGILSQIALGRWDDALANDTAVRAKSDDLWAVQSAVHIPHLLVPRGDRAALAALMPILEQGTEWAENDMMAKGCRAMIEREAGEPKAALADALEASLATISSSFSHTPLEFGEAVECALAANEPDVIAELLARADELQPVQLIPLLDAEAMRARAHLAVARGDTTAAAQWFRRSIDLFRELSTPFYLARAQLQYAELLGDTADARAIRDEAAATFEALGAVPWLARARAASAEVVA
jgi:tetratricopeptide (TPR) repeat protein